MKKKITCLAVLFALSACSDSGSESEPSATGNTVNTNTSDGSTGGATASAGSTVGTSTDGASAGAGTTDGALPGAGTTDGALPGGGTPGGLATSPVNQYGLVTFENIPELELSASFFSFETAVDFSVLIQQVKPATDTCVVTAIPVSGVRPPITDPFSFLSVVTPISAGDVLTVSSPAGSYAEILKKEAFGFISYSTDEELMLSAPAPANLSVSIPGAQFPAFTNIAVPPIDTLQVSSPGSDDRITANTSFTWNASSNPDSFIEITASTLSPEALEFVSVDCTVLDDGSFSFPANIQSELGSFSGFGSVSRQAVSIFWSGNSLLAVVSGSEP